MFDELGFINKEEINIGKNNIYSKKYNYKNNSMVIQSEDYSFLNKNAYRKYDYFPNGYVKSINSSSDGEIKYEYDYKGFLTKEIINGNETVYTYDDNGNILSRNNDIFKYDEEIKDKLISYNNKKIEYDLHSPGNIIKIDNMTFLYEGRRLKKLINNRIVNSHETRELTIEYEYNDRDYRSRVW